MKTIHEYQHTIDSSESNEGKGLAIPFEQIVVNGIRCWVENPNAPTDNANRRRAWKELPDNSWYLTDAS